MGGNAVKSIVLLLVLVVLSAIIGSQFSGSLKESYGAFYVIGFVIAMFGMLIMGDKCWMLTYILPVLLIGMPYMHDIPFRFALSDGVLCCCIVMWLMGHIKLYWHSLLGMDLVILAFFAIMVVSFIRFPVAVDALGLEFEYVGGKEYVWCICAVVHYIAVSVLTPRSADIGKVMKWCTILMLLMQVPYCLDAYIHRRALISSDGVEARYAFLYIPGSTLLYYAYAKLPLSRLFLSLRTFFLFMAGVVMLFLSGGREAVLRSGMAALMLTFLKKELTAAVLVGVFIYGALLTLSTGHQLEALPFGVQRVLTMLPGVEVEHSIQRSTEGTSKTRLLIWELGLDPRTGLIKDYIFGDGFQLSTSSLARLQVAQMRGSSDFMKGGREQAYFLAAGNSWHNGWLTVLKRLGIVGLLAVNVFFLCGLFYLVKVSCAYFGRKEYPHIMAMCLPFAAIALTFVIGTQTFIHVFNTFISLSFIKMLYCTARDRGMVRPLFTRPQYVPMVIREQESPPAAAR